MFLFKNRRFFVWNRIWIDRYNVSRILINSTKKRRCIFFLANYYIYLFQTDIIFNDIQYIFKKFYE